MPASRKTDEPRFAISDQFRTAAESLVKGLSHVMTRMDERDEAELEVRTLEAQLAAAQARLVVYERRYEMTREIMAPQHEFHLRIMGDEAQTNLDALRDFRLSAKRAKSASPETDEA